MSDAEVVTKPKRPSSKRTVLSNTEIVDLALKTHVISPVSQNCAIFQYRRRGNSAYLMTIAVVPGHVFMGGDIGELTLTHYSSCLNPVAAMSWVASSSPDYLLSKSTLTKRIDGPATLKFLQETKKQPWGEGATERRKKMSELIAEVKDLLADGLDTDIPKAIYESNLFDDYYGCYDYSNNDYLHIEMLKRAAAAWLENQK